MVRQILAGNKTQTRRVAKEFPSHVMESEILTRFPKQQGCRYGVPGDRLWVRETFVEWYDEYLYRATLPTSSLINYDKVKKWHRSIFMPRVASRITLEIKNIRVERLNDISEKDAWAEGIPDMGTSAKSLDFANLWDTINGKKCPWQSNPWVWVIEFSKA